MRELLLNIAKHAQANMAGVLIVREGKYIHIQVGDDGIGFDVTDPRYKAGGFGLFNIRERLTAIGGSVTVESEIGQGTIVTLIAPLINDETTAGDI